MGRTRPPRPPRLPMAASWRNRGDTRSPAQQWALVPCIPDPTRRWAPIQKEGTLGNSILHLGKFLESRRSETNTLEPGTEPTLERRLIGCWN